MKQSFRHSVMGNNSSVFLWKSDSKERPVERVSWYDTVTFCNALSKKEGLGRCMIWEEIKTVPRSMRARMGIVCPQKRSGSMPAVQGRLARDMGTWMTSPGTMITVVMRHMQWVKSRQMRGVFMTCSEMCGSGVGTEKETTVQVQLWTQLETVLAPDACFVAAVGTAMRRGREQRIATGSPLTTAAFWAFAL